MNDNEKEQLENLRTLSIILVICMAVVIVAIAYFAPQVFIILLGLFVAAGLVLFVLYVARPL